MSLDLLLFHVMRLSTVSGFRTGEDYVTEIQVCTCIYHELLIVAEIFIIEEQKYVC